MQSDQGQLCWALRGPFPMSFANSLKRTCRPLQPVISTIVMLRILCAASAHVNVSVFYQPLTPPTGLGLLTSLRGGVPGRAARGSTPERQPAVAAGGNVFINRSRPATPATGAPYALPPSH